MKSTFAELAGIANTGLTMGVCVVVGLVGGMGIDHWFGTHPQGAAAGLGFGFLTAMAELYRLLKGSMQSDRPNPGSPGPSTKADPDRRG